jgi:hypothetical protein
MYVKKIHYFGFDLSKLHKEWLDVFTSVQDTVYCKNMPFWQRLNITHSSLQDADKTIITTQDLSPPLETFNVNNIVNVFKNSYTEQVVKEVNEWFLSKNQRVTTAKYACLDAHSVILPHIDKDYRLRYHIPVVADKGVSLKVNDIDHPIDELGYMYSMPGYLPHGANNPTDNIRLLLSLDVVKI